MAKRIDDPDEVARQLIPVVADYAAKLMSIRTNHARARGNVDAKRLMIEAQTVFHPTLTFLDAVRDLIRSASQILEHADLFEATRIVLTIKVAELEYEVELTSSFFQNQF